MLHPPRLYDPVIWNRSIDETGEPEPYDPMYWDLKTNFLDPREVEAQLLQRYGEEGFEMIKKAMIEAAQRPENIQLKRQMKYPMRVPRVLMELGTRLLFSNDFDEEYNARASSQDQQTDYLKKSVIDIMNEQYREEAKWLQ